METLGRDPNWLQTLSSKRQFCPRVIGSDYQPLALTWDARKLDSPILQRSMHQLVSFTKHGVIYILLAGGWCSRRDSRRSDIFESTERVADFKLVRNSCEWSARTQFAFLASVDGRSIYVLGGDDGSICSDIWLSRDHGRTFHLQCESAPWKGRIDFTSALVGTALVVCGGRIPARSDSGVFLNDVWTSQDEGRTWACISPSSPWKKRAGAAMVHVDGKLILAGGIGESSGMDDVWMSEDTGATWKRISSTQTPWKGRMSFNLMSDPVSKELLILGGTSADGQPLTDSWASVDGGRTWMPRKPLPHNTAPSFAVSTDHRRMLLVGSKGRAESISELKFLKRDCLTVLMLGDRLGHSLPRDTWIGNILPFVVDTRLLWDRKSVQWKRLHRL